MRIAFILPSLANAGPIIATQRLIDSIKQIAHVEIFYFDEILEVNIDVRKHKISFFDRINFDDFDIVHSTGLRPDLYSFKNRKSISKKAVSSIHCYITEDLTMLYGKFKSAIAILFWKMALKKMQTLIVSSNYMANYYRKILLTNNTIVIPYAVELPKNLNISVEDKSFFASLREKYKIIGNVSLLIKRKGLEQLIYLLKLRPDYAVVIIGDGELKQELIDLAKKENVADRFFILGFKDQSFRYYPYIDVYAMPSRSEGFSLATLEAFASNLPVISTRLPYYEEFFNDNQICYFELDNIESLVTAINRAEIYRERIIKNASIVFNNLFTLDSLSKFHLTVYNEIINRNQ